MDSSKKYTVSIFDEQYSFLTDEPETHMVRSAVLVDSLMKEIAQNSSSVDVKKVAVLAALRLASKLLKKEAEVEDTTDEQKKLIDHIDRELFSLFSR